MPLRELVCAVPARSKYLRTGSTKISLTRSLSKQTLASRSMSVSLNRAIRLPSAVALFWKMLGWLANNLLCNKFYEIPTHFLSTQTVTPSISLKRPARSSSIWLRAKLLRWLLQRLLQRTFKTRWRRPGRRLVRLTASSLFSTWPSWLSLPQTGHSPG